MQILLNEAVNNQILACSMLNIMYIISFEENNHCIWIFWPLESVACYWSQTTAQAWSFSRVSIWQCKWMKQLYSSSLHISKKTGLI